MTGKWATAGVPHKGWTCVDIHEGETMICEMCEAREVRLQHTMEHPDYGTLVVGSICAGHMEGDISRAKRRESLCKSARTGLSRSWRISKKGNPYLKVLGRHAVVYPLHGAGVRKYAMRLDDADPRYFESVEEAKKTVEREIVSKLACA